MTDSLREPIQSWRADAGATYTAWFLWEERLKNFLSIRRGLRTVVAQIEARTFGNVYKGSSLETVVRSIAEQRQLFKGAGRFLDTCSCCSTAERLIEATRGYSSSRPTSASTKCGSSLLAPFFAP